jgi:hypothetical protein
MRVLVDEHRELGRRLQAVHDLNTSAAGDSQRAAKLIDIFDRDALKNDRRSETGRSGAGVTGGFGGLRQRLAVGLLDILSRDLASQSGQRRPWSRWRGTLIARIRGARRDAFRTGLPPVQER